jgi:hypothetical protein
VTLIDALSSGFLPATRALLTVPIVVLGSVRCHFGSEKAMLIITALSAGPFAPRLNRDNTQSKRFIKGRKNDVT